MDKESKIPIIGAALVIEASVPPKGTITDMNGEFRFEMLNVSRYHMVSGKRYTANQILLTYKIAFCIFDSICNL